MRRGGFPALVEVVEQRGSELRHRPALEPALEPPVASRLRWVSVRQVVPRSTGPQDPEDPVQHVARIAPRAASLVLADACLREERREHFPLLVGEVHSQRRSQLDPAVDPLSEIRFGLKHLPRRFVGYLLLRGRRRRRPPSERRMPGPGRAAGERTNRCRVFPSDSALRGIFLHVRVRATARHYGPPHFTSSSPNGCW